MTVWRIDPNLPLELLNGAGMVLEFCFLSWVAVYLWRETRRRGLTWRDWFFRMPPSMHLAVAIMVFDGGVFMRSSVIWIWRRYLGAGDFSVLQLSLLGYGGMLIVVGSLCKIRAISKPDYGDGPWLISAGAVAAFLLATVIFH